MRSAKDSAKRARRDRTGARVRLRLETVLGRLLDHYGVPNWWPAESKWEIMVGAILTQNTSWKNVEKALANLKREGALDPASVRDMDTARLAALIRPAGFVTSKPKRLKILVEFLFREYSGDPAGMRETGLSVLRGQLLALNGVGPETADAILLYAAEQPIFVVDAYTRRIFARMGRWRTGRGEITERTPYHDLQSLFMEHLPPDTAVFNTFHALLDIHAKYTCTKRAPRCERCPLRGMCLKIGVP